VAHVVYWKSSMHANLHCGWNLLCPLNKF